MNPVLYTFIVIFLLLATNCGEKVPSSDRESQPGRRNDTISVGFYNVENLFDLRFDGQEYPEYRPGALGWNKQTQEKKLENIAAVISAMEVDIIGLCEVENRNALEELRKRLRKNGKNYRHIAIADAPYQTVTCPALLSRHPILSSCGLGAASAGKARRNILEADVEIAGLSLKLFVNHWPSKAHPESDRLAMAQRLARRLRQLPAGTPYIIMGDLNANYDEWRTFHTLGFDDTRGRTGINHELRTIHLVGGRFAGYITAADIRDSGDGRHFMPWLEVAERRRFSLFFRGLPQTPDHLLFPASLMKPGGIVYCDSSFTPFTWGNRLFRDGTPFRWQMKGYGSRRFHEGEGYSDHLPMRAKLIRRYENEEERRERNAGTGDAGASGDAGAVREKSSEGEAVLAGWVACSPGISVHRERAGDCYSLRLRGADVEKNCCAARVVFRREPCNGSRWFRVVMGLRGSGKISVRIRAGSGAWCYFNGPIMTRSGSARYFPVSWPSRRQFVFSCQVGDPRARDVSVEVRAGAGSSFDFSISGVSLR